MIKNFLCILVLFGAFFTVANAAHCSRNLHSRKPNQWKCDVNDSNDRLTLFGFRSNKAFTKHCKILDLLSGHGVFTAKCGKKIIRNEKFKGCRVIYHPKRPWGTNKITCVKL